MSDQPVPPPGAASTPPEPAAAPPAASEKKQKAPKPASERTEKLMKFVNDNFSNVFSRSHWVYTIIFFIAALFIAILRWFNNSLPFAIYIATSLVFTFFILFVISTLDSAAPLVLEGTNFKKLIIFLVIFGISIGLAVLAILGTNNLPTQYQLITMLPAIYMLVFFGWNFIQIFFIKKGLEDVSLKVEKKAFSTATSTDDKKGKGTGFLVLGIAVPFAMLAGVIGLLFMDDNTGPTRSSGYLLWDSTYGQLVLLAWLAGMFILLGVASFNASLLFKQTVKHGTPSVFSSFIHMFFFIYILFRSYQFINAAGKAFRGSGTVSWANDLLDAVIMVITLLLLFKGLGSKLSRSSMFSQKNLPFASFLFATVVIMGNMVPILTINVESIQSIVSAGNAFMMMATAIIYYFLYLKRKLMQSDYLERDMYSLHEVQEMFAEYSDTLAGKFTMDKATIRTEMEKFLIRKDIPAPRALGTVPSPAPAPLLAATTAASPAAPKPKPKKAGFFSGLSKADSGDKAAEPASPAEDKPVESKYPIEQPKKVDEDKKE
nr:hypothetical protein [Candidatus Sigynarchaeota archaeon]